MLTLPAGHTDSELDLARLVARRLECRELHVFWTGSRPGPESVTTPDPLSGPRLAMAAVGALIDGLASALSPRRARARS